MDGGLGRFQRKAFQFDSPVRRAQRHFTIGLDKIKPVDGLIEKCSQDANRKQIEGLNAAARLSRGCATGSTSAC